MIQPRRTVWNPREDRRGTLLVVVLGLLVALFVIGTSFSFVTLAERRAAENYLDRQRALDLALDGIEYSVARLRAEAAVEHYEGIKPTHAGVGKTKDYDPRLYALRPIDLANPAVTWSRSTSVTSLGGNADGNWIDFDGDGAQGGNEKSHGTDKVPATLPVGAEGFAAGVTGFAHDGISMNQVRKRSGEGDESGAYGPSGTYEALGDYFRVRTVDAASLLPLNNFKKDELSRVLLVLGDAIDAWLNNGKGTGKENPFPPDIVADIRKLSEENGNIINNKDDLRPIYAGYRDGERLFEIANNFITTESWQDPAYRDWCEANTEIVEGPENPKRLTEQERMRAGWADTASSGMDGWPDWQPGATGFSKSPININTAPKPVLVAMLAGIEAKARLLFYQKQDLITANDQLYFDNFTQAVPQQTTGTTDLGRQNNHADVAGVLLETNWYPSGSNSRGIFQMVPIGPIETLYGKKGQTSSQAGGAAEHAGALADQIILMRSQTPFQSWQDFDARFLREMLLRIPSTGRSGMTVPDLVGVNRGDLNAFDSNAVRQQYPESMLPKPENCEHAANPLKSGDAAMKGGDFRAWYWKSVVDMLRAALCPVNISNRYNADYPYHTNVDRMDLTVANAPVCFSSMGIYEVVSMGEIMAPPKNQTATTSGNIQDRLPIARRKVRSVIKIYDIWRHSTQSDFMTSPDPIIFNRPSQTSSSTTPPAVAYTRLTKSNTKSGPFSIDERTTGIMDNNTATEQQLITRAEDSRNIGYRRDPSNPNVYTDARDRWKGHNDFISSSREAGWVTMDPQDRTPFTYTDGRSYPLNFHARFNESLRARTEMMSDTDSTITIEGVCSDNPARDQTWGHLPVETNAIFDDFISSASPRDTGHSLKTPGGAPQEFSGSSEGDEATRYATLMPDGVRMSGQSLRFRAQNSLVGTYGMRGLSRLARLKILRYPCGSHYSEYPFMPVQPTDGSYPQGVKDSDLPGMAWDGSSNEIMARMRLEGLAPPWRGLDDHNRAVENHRQRRSNMPYYEGTIDFWIKWDLPPQGSERMNIVAAMGEIDPASHNFSGLFGATAYGRFRVTSRGMSGSPVAATDVTTPYHAEPFINNPTSNDRDDSADFEGVQFFVYKEPGGLLRFTRMYFSEAFGANVTSGSTGSSGMTINRFGNALRRIVGPLSTADGGPFPTTDPYSPYTGTNEMCNDPNNDKGFLFSRIDSWVDLSNATYVNAGAARLVLRPHDWHRFTLSYTSNTPNTNDSAPYRLWIDGRQVAGVQFFDDPTGDAGFRNDGRHKGPTGAYDEQIPTESASTPSYLIYRTTVKLLEINPEDRLTVGCIFRRQPDIKDTNWYNLYFNQGPDPSNVTKAPRPVFKFDSNFVAVANATIDDFRISAEVIPSTVQQVPTANMQANSRYIGPTDPNAANCFYENGFWPMREGDEKLLGSPVRVGTISWTELRPDFDPYRARGLDLANSARVRMEWAVFEDYQSVDPGGGVNDLRSQKYKGESEDMRDAALDSTAYWARGGMGLRGAVVPSGSKVGLFMYRVHFQAGEDLTVNNVTPYLLEVKVTVLTPPRKVWFKIEY